MSSLTNFIKDMEAEGFRLTGRIFNSLPVLMKCGLFYYIERTCGCDSNEECTSEEYCEECCFELAKLDSIY